MKQPPANSKIEPTARAARMLAGINRSALIANVTSAIARKSMTPSTSRTAVSVAQQQTHRRPIPSPCRQAAR